MASFEIAFKPSVEKDFRVLPPALRARIMERIEDLSDDPFPRGSQKLSGAQALHRLRIGDYRLIYEVDLKIHRITIHHIRHRREAYR